MIKIYLVWERESYHEYDVILVTEDEKKAQKISGEPKPSTWKESKSDMWYEERILEKEKP